MVMRSLTPLTRGALLFCTLTLAAAKAPSFTDDGIHKACEANDAEQIIEALDGGSDINLKGPGGQTPLFRSVLAGREEAVRTLLKKGADATIPEGSGFTVMHGAAFRGRSNLITLLAEHGVATNTQHKDGFTPLHRACWGNEPSDTETVRALLDLGVPPDTMAAPDCRHEELCALTPVQMARKHGNEATAALLEERLANPPATPSKAPSKPPPPPPPPPKEEKKPKEKKAKPTPPPSPSPPPPKPDPPPPPPKEDKKKGKEKAAPAKVEATVAATGGASEELIALRGRVEELVSAVKYGQSQVETLEARIEKLETAMGKLGRMAGDFAALTK